MSPKSAARWGLHSDLNKRLAYKIGIIKKRFNHSSYNKLRRT
jgi:hypothetical protein